MSDQEPRTNVRLTCGLKCNEAFSYRYAAVAPRACGFKTSTRLAKDQNWSECSRARTHQTPLPLEPAHSPPIKQACQRSPWRSSARSSTLATEWKAQATVLAETNARSCVQRRAAALSQLGSLGSGTRPMQSSPSCARSCKVVSLPTTGGRRLQTQQLQPPSRCSRL